jgi:hypothetical protein
MTLPLGVPKTFRKSYGATTVVGSTSAADIGEQRGSTHTTTAYQRSGDDLDQYPRRRRKPRDENVGKQLPTKITVAGMAARYQVMDALAAAGVKLIVHGPGQFSLSRKDAPRALAALQTRGLDATIS